MNARIAQRWSELAPLLDRLLDLVPEQRARYLSKNVPDIELANLLRELLRGERADGFLDGDRAAYAGALLGDPVEPAVLPAQIGSYRLQSLLGEGGSGSVYLAEREADGYTQRVALKLLRVGLRDPIEQERFRRERRILARLEHSSIARLLDGGFTVEGVPWFALEYVQGEPITQFCDKRSLSLPLRLQLFLAVCNAVEAAHRALIVHRDLKPANILVNTAGEPKLLDFGIAKLLDDSERGEDTRTGARRMTPAYAAPEQFSGGSITTATDVYALGVLLQELISGMRRHASDSESSGLPSRVFATSAAAGELARVRATTPAALMRQLRGDLDTIVATALAAEPQRRYPSVAALAADIQRHLEQRPIVARRASAGYRLQRFLQRHRLGAVAAALLLLSVIGGIAATLHEAQRAALAARTAQEQAQRAAAVKDFVLALFASVRPDESRGREVSARELIERGEARMTQTLASHPELNAELSTALAGAWRQLGAYERAANLAERAQAVGATGEIGAAVLTELGRIRAAQARFDDAQIALRAAVDTPDAPEAAGEARVHLAQLLAETGKPEAARALLDAAIASARADSPPADRLRNLAALGNVVFHAGDVAGAEQNLRAALVLARRVRGETHTETASIEHDLGVVLLQRGANEEAANLLEQAAASRRALLGARHPDLAQTLFNLGVARQRLGDNVRAGNLYTQALEQQQALLGAHHPDVANSLNSLALLAYIQGDPNGATERMREALAVSRAIYGAPHPSVATMLGNLATFERSAGQLDAAERDQREGLQIVRGVLGDAHYLVGVAQVGLASTQIEQGRSDQALISYREGLRILDGSLGRAHADDAQARAAYADLLLQLGQRDAARDEASAALAAIGDSLAQGNPKRARIALVSLRIDAASGDCVTPLASLTAMIEALQKGGNALRFDLASAWLLQARCLKQGHRLDQAASARATAEALLQQMPYVPRRLRAERAAAG